jgi:hypothetical protein
MITMMIMIMMNVVNLVVLVLPCRIIKFHHFSETLATSETMKRKTQIQDHQHQSNKLFGKKKKKKKNNCY